MFPRNRADDYAMIRAGQHPSDMKIPKNNLTDNSWHIVITAQERLTPHRFRALLADPASSEAFIRNMGNELEKTRQCYDHQSREAWVDSMIKQIKGNFVSHPLPDDGHSGPRLEPEPTHTTRMTDYSTTPVARPTLVYGEDVANMNEGRCIQIIKALNAEVKELTDTGVDSVTITKRIAERGAAIAEVVARLDTFAA